MQWALLVKRAPGIHSSVRLGVRHDQLCMHIVQHRLLSDVRQRLTAIQGQRQRWMGANVSAEMRGCTRQGTRQWL